MSVSYKVENVNISAVRDRAMFNTFAGNQSYVLQGIGNELEVTSSQSSFEVQLGTGEAVICGGSMLSEGTADTIALGSNETGYLVIEIDLSQTGDNICRFKNVEMLIQGDINNGIDFVYDFPLYEYTTNSNGVSSISDLRKISSGEKMSPVSSPTANNILLTDANGQAIDSGKLLSEYQELLTASKGINITNNVITSRLNMDLLWANASPGSQMAGQALGTFNPDYRLIVVIVRSNTANTTLYAGVVKPGYVSSIMCGESKIARRNFAFDDSTGALAIGNGSVANTYGSLETDNSVVIPVQIFGIK